MILFRRPFAGCVFLALILSVSVSFAGFDLTSPIAPTIPGIELPNTHWVKEGRLVRGQAPSTHSQDLIDQLGVTDVLIFKKQSRNEVDVEINDWLERGIPSFRLHHIPMPWRDFESQESACRMVVQALKIIRSAGRGRSPGTLFFHCTVGEDRTGLLAGLIRYLADGWDSARAFDDEMCARGYEAGDKNKVEMVVQAVRKELTPLYLRMVERGAEGRLSWDALDADEACTGIDQIRVNADGWKCEGNRNERE